MGPGFRLQYYRRRGNDFIAGIAYNFADGVRLAGCSRPRGCQPFSSLVASIIPFSYFSLANLVHRRDMQLIFTRAHSSRE